LDTLRLIKILNLTQSDSDGECLNAIRAANAMLKKEGVRWDDLISVKKEFVKVSVGWPFDDFRGKPKPASDFNSDFEDLIRNFKRNKK
jgi:hypothetical protein